MASYETTIGDLRIWLDRAAVKTGANRWPDRPAEEAVLLCWYDGTLGKSPPPGQNGDVSAPFDRYALFIDRSDTQTMVLAGYRDRLPAEAPHP